MANTYTQCYFHLIFAVKNRDALIKKEWNGDLEKYITGIVQNHRHKMLAIGAMPDHIHILIGYNVNQLIPDLVEEIKTSSNSLIKGEKLSKFKFEWQKGYGAFTHSRSQIDTVAKYIIIGIKYCGALHLWEDFQMHFYKYYAALPLNIRSGMCRASNYLQMNNCNEGPRCGAP